MKRVKLGEWTLDVDIDKTKELYQMKSAAGVKDEIDEIFSDKIKNFLEKLGLNPYQAAELHKCDILNGGIKNYSGFYHLVGKIVEGNDCWENFESEIKELHTSKINKNVAIGFTNDILKSKIKENILQMEFDINLD